MMALWQVQRRKAAAPMRMMMAKPSTMIDLGSCPDCSFADILKEAPLITDPLVEVRACTDATFETVALSIKTTEELDEAGKLAGVLSLGLKFFLFIVEEVAPEPAAAAAAAAAGPVLAADFFQRVRQGTPTEILQRPERRGAAANATSGATARSTDLVYNWILDLWAQRELGFPATDGVHTDSALALGCAVCTVAPRMTF
jgi:hypothetical protein